MIKRAVVRTLFVAGTFLFFVLYLAPADKLVSLIDLPPGVRLYDVKGDLWRGRIGTADIAGARVSDVEWRLNLFTALFSGGMTVFVRDPERITGSFDVNLTGLGREIRLGNVRLKTFAGRIAPLLKTVVPLRAEGGAEARFDRVTLTPGGALKEADGEILLTDFLVQHPFDPRLMIDCGRVRVGVRGGEKTLDLDVDQESDMFSLDAAVKITGLSEYDLTGTLKPGGSLPDGIAGLVAALGRPGPDGRIPLKYRGKLP